MSHFPDHLVLGVAVLVATLAVQALTVNRLVKRKLLLSVVLTLAYLGVNLFIALTTIAIDEPRWRAIEQLLLGLAVINLLVVTAINPLRVDHVPDRFPTIVQDTITVVLGLMIATVVMPERFLTTSAVGAVVVGFALQDTLGNAFAGLALQVEKPFRVGHWIRVGEFEGRVVEITWRATKLTSKWGNYVVVPNNVMSREAIYNFSEPTIPSAIGVKVGASYLTPPNEVKSAILEATNGAGLVLHSRPVDIVITDFGDSAIVYEARFWIADYGTDHLAADEVRSRIYYVFRRRNIEIPWPIQVEYGRQEPPLQPPDRPTQLAAILAGVDVLAPLSDAERAEIVALSIEELYAAGEAIVHQGEQADSMFVLCGGKVRITLDPGGREVAVLERGQIFGEMSLLTGEPRNATATAITDTSVLEITADTFRRILLANPGVVAQVGARASARQSEIERLRTDASGSPAPREGHATLLERMRRFLRLR